MKPPLDSAGSHVELADGTRADERVRLTMTWDGPWCRPRITNTLTQPVRVRSATLFVLREAFPPESRAYGEGFQMLSQSGGTLADLQDFTRYTDAKHYRLPTPPDAKTVYGLLAVSPPGGAAHVVLAFTSCHRLVGEFRVAQRGDVIDVVVDLENLELRSGESWDVEEFAVLSGPDRAALLDALAERIAQHHPPLKWDAPPTGWCSWYCFGPRVTAENVTDNLDVIVRRLPELRYVQVDDGYQPAMGDWLDTGAAFGGNVQGVLASIRDRGFESAIWVAPFIADNESRVLAEHPDWFVKGDDGKPLPSDRVTFGGWRRKPWYVLDGTHPAVQSHFERMFRTMRTEWGVTYFKLDANFWGAIHAGRFYDPRATRVEAYRRGMAAILRGAGPDSFILGCNHPIWPSLGLIHGSRSSGDIKRTWPIMRTTARENLSRNWQNRRLWWNDPDCVVLTGDLSDDEFQFHATALAATGGMILSGDDLTKLPERRFEQIRKLLPPTGVAAAFEDDSLSVGRARLPDRELVFVFNWTDELANLSVTLPAGDVTDFWTGERLSASGPWRVKLPPHAARLLVCS